MPRRYELKERARAQEATRQRIVDATVALHREVGPARTTVAEIARRAGVGRVTVYNHFPDDDRRCWPRASAQWLAEHPPPDPAAWAAIENPAQAAARARSRSSTRYFARQRGDARQLHARRRARRRRSPRCSTAGARRARARPCARPCSPAARCARARPPAQRRRRARARVLHLAAPDRARRASTDADAAKLMVRTIEAP